MKLKFMILCVAIVTSAMLSAATLNDAKEAYNKGDYATALPIFMEQYKKNANNGSVNHWLGVCLYKTGKTGEAIKYLEVGVKRKVVESNRYLALASYMEYDYEKAQSALDQYEADLKRNKKDLPDDMKQLQKRLMIAPVMLDHVEKIVIIDSIVVDKGRFFKRYNLSESSGSLNGVGVLPENMQADTTINMVYATESGDRLLWSGIDSVSKKSIYEVSRLYGDEWDSPVKLSDVLNEDGDAIYPFLMQDGITLYYSNNGRNSIGGYDLFMSRKDLETGRYLQPQNLGMPYNSPYDDYMFAIDEEKKVGWWATDRNQIPDKVTIYLFIKNDTRENYHPDDADIISQAFIKNYHSTWEGKDYSQKLKDVLSLKTDDMGTASDFVFNVYNGVVYTSFADFKSQEGASMMEELLVMEKKLNDNIIQLKNLRSKYASSTATEKGAMKNEILQLENTIDKSRIDIKWMANSIRKLENK